MSDDNFQTIYDIDDSKEYAKYWQYYILLEQNQRFIADVEKLRSKYGIVIGPGFITQDMTDNKYTEILQNPSFMKDVMRISAKIKLAGDWSSGVAYYVCGTSAQDCLFPFDTSKRIEARAVKKGGEPYYEVRFFGDFTREEMNHATKAIRPHMVKVMGYKKVKDLDENVLRKVTLFNLLRKNKDDKSASDEMFDTYMFVPQAYSDLRVQSKAYKEYSDRLY